MYAAGFILENNLRLADSAASVYDTLIRRYPSSQYVKNIAMKVNIYKQEKARIEKQKQEAMLNQNQQVKDDTSNVTNLAFLGNKDEEMISEDEIKKQEESVISQPIKKEETIKTTKRKLERLWNPRKLKR
jgi:hypothetical protein